MLYIVILHLYSKFRKNKLIFVPIALITTAKILQWYKKSPKIHKAPQLSYKLIHFVEILSTKNVK